MNEQIKRFLKSDELRNVLTIISFIGLLFAFYITSRLAPLIQDINDLTQRVEAITQTVQTHIIDDKVVENKTVVNEQKIISIQQVLTSIQTNQDRIENKIDRLLLR